MWFEEEEEEDNLPADSETLRVFLIIRRRFISLFQSLRKISGFDPQKGSKVLKSIVTRATLRPTCAGPETQLARRQQLDHKHI